MLYFQDHYGTAALAFLIDYPISMVQTRFENIPSVLKYAVFGTGKSVRPDSYLICSPRVSTFHVSLFRHELPTCYPCGLLINPNVFAGPLTSLGAIEGLAWIPTKYANKSIDLPDIELHFASGAIGETRVTRFRHDCYQIVQHRFSGKNYQIWSI